MWGGRLHGTCDEVEDHDGDNNENRRIRYSYFSKKADTSLSIPVTYTFVRHVDVHVLVEGRNPILVTCLAELAQASAREVRNGSNFPTFA